MPKDCPKKGFSTEIIEDNAKLLSFTTYIRYNDRTSAIGVTNAFYYNGNSIRTGLVNYHRSEICHLSACKGGMKPISDKEMKEKVREIVRKNPSISMNEITKETGYSKYKLSRIYMPIKRELY